MKEVVEPQDNFLSQYFSDKEAQLARLKELAYNAETIVDKLISRPITESPSERKSEESYVIIQDRMNSDWNNTNAVIERLQIALDKINNFI